MRILLHPYLSIIYTYLTFIFKNDTDNKSRNKITIKIAFEMLLKVIYLKKNNSN